MYVQLNSHMCNLIDLQVPRARLAPGEQRRGDSNRGGAQSGLGGLREREDAPAARALLRVRAAERHE